MSENQQPESNNPAIKLVLVAIVVIVAAVTFVIAKPNEAPKPSPAPQTQTESDSTPDKTTPDDPEPTETGTAGSEPKPKPKPPENVIKIKDGKPVGGVRTLRFDKGERIIFSVQSDAADHVHLHGYDVFKDIAAGGSVKFDLKADIDGVFEAELEDIGLEIVEIQVMP